MFTALLFSVRTCLSEDKIDQCLQIGTLYDISVTIELDFLGIFTFIHVGTCGDGEALSMKEGGRPLPFQSCTFHGDDRM